MLFLLFDATNDIVEKEFWSQSQRNRMLGFEDSLMLCSSSEDGIFFFCKKKQQIVNILSRPQGFCGKYSTLPWWWESSHRQFVNEWTWLCSKRASFTEIASGFSPGAVVL